jgi:hypothetical protein
MPTWKLILTTQYDNAVAPTLLSSKSFSPSAFLSHHHPDATFQDLRYGVEYLRRNVESKGEEVRTLVEREFGRFVGVKGSNDGKEVTGALSSSKLKLRMYGHSGLPRYEGRHARRGHGPWHAGDTGDHQK